MTGYEFEHFCKSYLENDGFENVTVTRASGDGGVDVIAYKYDVKYVIQCKFLHKK